MNRSIEELKIRAKKLHRKAQSGDPDTLRSMKIAPSATDELKRKTCLNVVASKLGFKDWGHAKDALSGTALDKSDMGKIWYSAQCTTLLNNWFASYDEAKRFLNDHPHMYLLPYKDQYMVVAQDFIETIGLYDGYDKIWAAISHDIVEYYNSDEWHELIWHRIRTIKTP